ncbi:MAG: hypothetical protein WKF75_00050 [Singulisphaera sp.]
MDRQDNARELALLRRLSTLFLELDRFDQAVPAPAGPRTSRRPYEPEIARLRESVGDRLSAARGMGRQ